MAASNNGGGRTLENPQKEPLTHEKFLANMLTYPHWPNLRLELTQAKIFTKSRDKSRNVIVIHGKLKSLELWRSRSITHEGLLHIYTNCRDLEEIDLGWCPELKSRTLCFVELTQNCTKLKKLFLTANRTVCDEDLLAIAKHCKEMEQLDILGTREVSAFAAQRVLENCKKLIMFDVSFCSGIDFPMMETWKKEFPHCEIKKSYQN